MRRWWRLAQKNPSGVLLLAQIALVISRLVGLTVTAGTRRSRVGE